MSESSVSRTPRKNVFDKLDTSYGDASPVIGGEDLQYPSDLGTDEYNQFIVFTVYEKFSENFSTAERRLTEARGAYYRLAGENAEQIGIEVRSAIDGFLNESFGPLQATSQFYAQKIQDIGVPALIQGATEWITSNGLLQRLGGNQELIDAALQAETAKIILDAASEAEATTPYFANNNKNFEQRTAKPIGQAGSDYNTYYGDLGIKQRGYGSMNARSRLKRAAYKRGSNIALYLPNKLVNNGSINYSGVNFEIIKGIGDLAQGDLTAFGPSLKRGFSSIVNDVLGFVGVDINAPEAIDAITGLAINPREEQVFQGVATRTFDFTFSLAPRNPNEAVEINKIIREFRKYSHPSVVNSGFFLTIPAEFDIRYYKITPNGTALENLFLNRIGRCSLTNINVDYTPNGINSTFEDGSPVRTSVTMTFTELRPLVRQDIEEGF